MSPLEHIAQPIPYPELAAEFAPLAEASILLVTADGAEPDNAALFLAAAKLAEQFGLQCIGVVSGRPHSDTPDAPLEARDLPPADLTESRRLQYRGAQQTKALLARNGFPDAHIYIGRTDIEHTDLTAGFSHAEHAHPDIYLDAFPFEAHEPTGDFEAFLAEITNTTGGIIHAMGGPLIDYAEIIRRHPDLAERTLGMIGQGSFIDSAGTLHSRSGHPSFNVRTAQESADFVRQRLLGLGRFILTIGSVFTRDREVSFADHQDLRAAGIIEDLVRLYTPHVEKLIVPLGYKQPGSDEQLRLAMHDLRVAQLVELALRISRGEASQQDQRAFTVARVIGPLATAAMPGKLLIVTGQDPAHYKDFLRRYMVE